MSQPLTIEIPEAVYQSLQQRAKQLGKTPEVVATECIVTSMGSTDDSLLRWAGALDVQPNDVAERHDHYLGRSLADELRDGVHE